MTTSDFLLGDIWPKSIRCIVSRVPTLRVRLRRRPRSRALYRTLPRNWFRPLAAGPCHAPQLLRSDLRGVFSPFGSAELMLGQRPWQVLEAALAKVRADWRGSCAWARCRRCILAGTAHALLTTCCHTQAGGELGRELGVVCWAKESAAAHADSARVNGCVAAAPPADAKAAAKKDYVSAVEVEYARLQREHVAAGGQ